MNFIIENQEELTKKLALNMKAVSSSRLIQSLKSFKISIQGNILEITSYNGESCVISVSEIINESAEDCVFLVDANTFKSVIDKFIELNAKSINVFIDLEQSKMHLNCRGIEFYLNIMKNIEGFESIPTIDTFKDYKTAVFNKAQLKRALLNTQKCSSKDPARPILEAISIFVDEKSAEVVALDGFRMACNQIECESEDSFKVSLSTLNTMSIVYDILKGGYDFVEINSDGVYTMIENDDTVVFLKQVAGELPNYKQLLKIDDKEASSIVVDKKTLESALNATRIGSSGSVATELVVNPKANSFTVKSRASLGASENIVDEFAISVDATMNFTQEERISLFFNNIYLIEILQSIYTEKCELIVRGNSKPLFIYNKDDKKSTYLLSPVSVR